MNFIIERTGMRVIPALISFIMLLIFAAPFFHGIVNLGNCFGVAVTATLTGIFTFFGAFSGLVRQMWNKPCGRFIVISVSALAAVFVIYAATVSVFMIRAASDRPKDGNTTLVVLGCKVKNGAPSRMLRIRLDAAYDFLLENPEANAVVSGGQGSDESISEAQCMRDYLVSRGISSGRIYMEDRSVNTEENLRFSKALIEREGLCGDVTIVTDSFHQLRAEMIAKKQGVEPHNISAETSWWLVPTYWVREWFGVAYYGIFGR